MAKNINQKKPHGGKVLGLAAGDAPNTGSPGPTPPPTKKLAPDVISAPRAATPQGYGMSPGHNPSSIPPGTQLLSPMAEVLKEGQDDGEGVLDRITKEGTARRDDAITSQLRKIADGNVPNHPNMKSPNKTGGTYEFDTLPAKCGSPAADFDARRAAAVKRD